MNSADNGNHWLVLELVGTSEQPRRHRSNREADHRRLAAPFTITSSVSVGFMSSSDKRVHFGLGLRKTQIRTVEIRWPARRHSADWTAVATDQFCRVEEPLRQAPSRG